MQGYMLGLVAISLLCGVCDVLSPEDGTGRLVRFVSGLCILCVCMMPLGKLVSGIEWWNGLIDAAAADSEEYEEKFQMEMNALEESTVSEILQRELCQALKLSEEELSVTLRRTDSVNVYVTLSGKGIAADPRAIQTYVTERLDCVCEIIYE
ncbi:MAG: hypothetical protein E7664_02890 [Ruminococcaceae bacterium]|nr:hypothetical protein [Oscillospiraceae bacterium]